MAFKSRLKCLFLKPIFYILFATFLHFARNTTAKAKKNGENLEEKAKETVDAFGATIIGDRTQFKDAADQALAGYDLD